MNRDKMTRDEAIAAVGLTAVMAAEADNCEPTCRVGGNGLMHNDPYIEYEGSAKVDYDNLTPEQVYNLPLDHCTIVAVYQEDNEQEQAAIDADCNTRDIDDIEIDHYCIV